MISAPIIVGELDALSESLKTLAIELIKFFADVDGDIDGILIIMDWAKRELAALPSYSSGSLSSGSRLRPEPQSSNLRRSMRCACNTFLLEF